MQIINIRGPGSNPRPDSYTDRPSTPATRIPRQPIEILLTKVGKIVLGDELHTEFIGIGKVARIAQKYKIDWPGHTHRTERLEELVRQCFENHDRILGDGIKVTWQIEHGGWESEVQLRFHCYDPANDGPLPN